MKKLPVILLTSAFLSVSGISAVTASASENETSTVDKAEIPQIISPEEMKNSKSNPYVFEIETVLASPEARALYGNDESLKTTVDFSEATFYDADGNELDKGTVLSTMFNQNVRGLSGGSWTSGTGYRICKGMKVSHTNAFSQSSFKVDFQLVQGGYDSIDRMYSTDWGSWGGTISGTSAKIFRAKETSTLSAYAGITYTFNGNIGGVQGSKKVNNFIRVGSDKYWHEIL